MCVSALIVLGDKIRNRIDEQTQEQWLMSYIGECCDLYSKPRITTLFFSLQPSWMVCIANVTREYSSTCV